MVVLMLLGGSPGSTAGGMKTTTFAVLLANMWATFRRREDAEFFGRRIDGSAVKNAATIAGMYLTLFFLEPLSLLRPSSCRCRSVCMKLLRLWQR